MPAHAHASRSPKKPPKKAPVGSRRAGAASAGGSTKKPRWTAAQKAARAEAESRSGRPGKKPHRGQAGAPPRTMKKRAEQPGRDERRERSAYRGDRDERPAYRDRDDRRTSRDRVRGQERPAYRDRDDRPAYRDRDDRRTFRDRDERRERPAYRGRDERPAYRDRDERPAYRPDRDERPTFRDRDERRERPAYRDRDDRPRREPRATKARFDRPAHGETRGRVADPARRDRHEGRHLGPAWERERPRDWDLRRDRAREDGAEHPTFEEAEAERAEADTWTKYESHRSAAAVTDDNGFAALGVPERLVERLARDGIVDPFPIQAATIPDALAGRDVLGRGRTGSGKTMAFGLPLIARLSDGTTPAPKRPRSLILVPTRELAMQVSDALEPLVHVAGLRHKLVAGGLSYEGQFKALDKGLDILIATPGRLGDLLERGAVDLGDVQIAVLDEADHMADMGFLPEVTEILDKVPPGGQRLLFSATLDKGIDTLVERYLADPVEHSTDDAQAAVTTMSHHVFLIDPHEKKDVTAQLAGREGRVIVFVRTQLGGDRVARELRERGVLAAALHGGLTQSVRNRVLGAFRDGRLNVLVATDVAARGIHVDDVGLVIQVDPPGDHKDYLHRSGRTARAGEEGVVVTLALPHQKAMMRRLIEAAGAEAEAPRVKAGDSHVTAVGGRPAPGVPVPEELWKPILEGPPRRGRAGGPRKGGGPKRFGPGSRSGRRPRP